MPGRPPVVALNEIFHSISFSDFLSSVRKNQWLLFKNISLLLTSLKHLHKTISSSVPYHIMQDSLIITVFKEAASFRLL